MIYYLGQPNVLVLFHIVIDSVVFGRGVNPEVVVQALTVFLIVRIRRQTVLSALVVIARVHVRVDTAIALNVLRRRL